MNITLYYLSKKIILQTEPSENENSIEIDNLKKKQIKLLFSLFINSTIDLLVFETESIEIGLEKLKKVFKIIYAAGGLIEENNKFLFIYRLKKWDLPKGKLDMGESPEEAAIRECEEECGITKLTILNELAPTYHLYTHKGGFALKKTYWYKMKTEHVGVLVPQLEEKIERAEWLGKQEINEMVLNNSYPAILDVIKVIN